MAAYPSFPMQRNGTRMTVEGGHRAERASNGALRVQRMFANPRRQFEITHWLNASDKSTFDTFYSDNKDLNVDLTWPEDGVTYTARFIGHPQALLQVPGLWIVTVKMAEV